MKKEDSECSLNRGALRSARLLTDSMSSDEPETERLLNTQPSVVVAMCSGRRQSLTAPPSPTDYRKKRDNRQHNYMNHLHHLIHWRDIWGGEPHKTNEVYTIKDILFLSSLYF
ncbi:unnamed protein product [Euphydryas editha]|uniref:Uncharacterized protein n=1 Tax=Euphydryas editha TaxID=104508 RepID=A0AAU9THN3_EUPED|nr:unnamed protein product [Euphydryas editha]